MAEQGADGRGILGGAYFLFTNNRKPEGERTWQRMSWFMAPGTVAGVGSE
jgi:hypothetical protein